MLVHTGLQPIGRCASYRGQVLLVRSCPSRVRLLPQILHCDIKSGNILLGRGGVAKIAGAPRSCLRKRGKEGLQRSPGQRQKF